MAPNPLRSGANRRMCAGAIGEVICEHCSRTQRRPPSRTSTSRRIRSLVVQRRVHRAERNTPFIALHATMRILASRAQAARTLSACEMAT